MADWHDGSKGAQISARNKAIEIMYDEGVRDIIVAGDINAGRKVYKGQELDTVSERPDDQIAITETYCPRCDGLRYHLMGGNHDYSSIKEGGHNALEELCGRRDDFLYYGYDLVTVRITPEVDALVWHPRGGQAYAMCLDEDSQILTRRGWATVWDINLSDEVATLNPRTEQLEYQNPKELFIEQHKGPMVHFQSRTIDHLVTPEHELWARKYNLDGAARVKGNWQKVTAKELLEAHRQEWQLSMTAEWKGQEIQSVNIPFKPWSGAIDLGDVPADTLLEFIGWYVSEGHIEKGKAVCVTNTDKSVVDRICSLMQAIGLNARVYEEDREDYKTIYRVRGHSANLCRWLEEHCGSGSYNKKVPHFVKGLSPRQIGIFLDSLCDGDGWGHREEGTPRWRYYKSVSAQLLDDVQELALRVGQAATIHSGGQTLTFLEQNQPTINSKPTIEDYDGLVWCVRVPNGLIYARRNGRPIWTGNSYRSQKMVEQVAFEQLMEVIKKNATPKVRFLFVGHWHGILMGYEKGPIHIQHPGAFEGQTNLSRQMGVFPELAAVILEGKITKDRNIIRDLTTRCLRFTEIENDFLNYPVPQSESIEHEPLFQWDGEYPNGV